MILQGYLFWPFLKKKIKNREEFKGKKEGKGRKREKDKKRKKSGKREAKRKRGGQREENKGIVVKERENILILFPCLI